MHGRCVLLCLFLAGLFTASPIRAQQRVDLALVLAVDVSSSMMPVEQDFQRAGFVEAFLSPLVHEVIRKGSLGRIAVVYVEWSGGDDQTVLVPWTLIDGPEAARAFAKRLAHQPMRRA